MKPISTENPAWVRVRENSEGTNVGVSEWAISLQYISI